MNEPTDIRDSLYSKLRAQLPASCLVTESESQRPFECDGLPLYRELPLLVALPETLEQTQHVMRVCHELGVPVPLSSVVMEIMQALKVDGKATDDHGGIIQFYEKLAKTEVRK